MYGSVKVASVNCSLFNQSANLNRIRARWSGHQATHGTNSFPLTAARATADFLTPDSRPRPQYRDCVPGKPYRNRNASYVLIWAVLFPRFLSPDLRKVWGCNATSKNFRASESYPLHRYPRNPRWTMASTGIVQERSPAALEKGENVICMLLSTPMATRC
jgi:hypothetical protein